MTDVRPEVVLLARRHEAGPLARPLLPMLDRLENRGFAGRVLCLESTSGGDPARIHVAPWPRARLLRPYLLRRLWTEEFAGRPRLLHVLDDELAPLGLDLAEIAGVPYIQSVNGFAVIENGLRLSRRWCRGLTAATAELAREMVSRLGVPPELITVVPPGVDAAFDRPSAPIAGRARLVGAVHGGDDRGLLVFVEAARLVIARGFDAEFVVADSKAPLASLRRRLDSLGITDRVTVADHPLASREIWRILDVFCAPGRGESSSRALVHALAHAIPAVAADIQGLTTLIEHRRTGLLVNPDDPPELANAIAELLENPAQARELGQNGQLWTRSNFNPDAEADLITTIYRKTLNLASSSAPIPVVVSS